MACRCNACGSCKFNCGGRIPNGNNPRIRAYNDFITYYANNPNKLISSGDKPQSIGTPQPSAIVSPYAKITLFKGIPNTADARSLFTKLVFQRLQFQNRLQFQRLGSTPSNNTGGSGNGGGSGNFLSNLIGNVNAVLNPNLSIQQQAESIVNSRITNDVTSRSVTVGNQSSPEASNRAVIKSLQVSVGDTWEATVEIVDEAGGEFAQFINEVYDQTNAQNGGGVNLIIDFGWIRKFCDNCSGARSNYFLSSLPNPIGGFLANIIYDIQTSYEGGKVKFTIKSPSVVTSQLSPSIMRNDLGTDDHTTSLRQAIQTAFNRSRPATQVGFGRFDNNAWGPFSFSQGGADGPSSTWDTNGRPPLSVGRDLIDRVTTENRRGIISRVDPLTDTLVYQEDPSIYCPRTQRSGETFATYIVGGNCSSVINFSPSIKWLLAPEAQSAATGSSTNQQVNSPARQAEVDRANSALDETCNQVRNLSLNPISLLPLNIRPLNRPGMEVVIPAGQNDIMWRSPTNNQEQFQNAIDQHLLAERSTSLSYSAVTAELKIQGDPRYTSIYVINKSKKIGIIVVNPFHVGKDTSTINGSCRWLASPSCNSVLTSREWTITGADHQISAGTYTTTLKLMLIPQTTG